jgi:hypothetical protein
MRHTRTIRRCTGITGPVTCGSPIFRSVQITSANTSRTEQSVGPCDDVDDSTVLRVETQNCRCPSPRVQIHLTLPSVAKALSPRTKESRRGRRETGCNGRCRGGPRPLLCALLYGPEGDVGRGPCRVTVGANAPIDGWSVNGGARRIDRRDWAQRHVRGVDDVLIVRVREHHRRDQRLATEWFAKNVRQVCDRVVGRPRR